MTFTPNIPQSGQSLGQTRDPIRNNFTNYATVIAVNHLGPNGANAGKHNLSEYVVQAQSPATSTNEVATYCRAPSGNPNLYLQGQNHLANDPDVQMSRLEVGIPVSGTAGWTFLPGGMIMQWNIGAAHSGGSVEIFPIVFPNNCFGVNVGMVGATISSLHSVWCKTNYPSSVLADRTQFLAASDSGALGIFYIAIGN